jgi:hypothetical protein
MDQVEARPALRSGWTHSNGAHGGAGRNLPLLAPAALLAGAVLIGSMSAASAGTLPSSGEPVHVAQQLPPASPVTGQIRRGANGQLQLQPEAAAQPTAPPRAPYARTLKVGPGQLAKSPSAAAAIAGDGDTIEIEAGEYADCAIWRANHLTIVGLGAGAVLVNKTCAGKGIFVINGNDVTVRNITFSGAKVSDGNGAGIRAEGRNLLVEHSRFLNNENGILTNPSPLGSVIVRDSEFVGNGTCAPTCAHGIYASEIALLRVEHCRFFETNEGHHIKSRALNTEVVDNDIEDGPKGTSSFLVELPNGGSLIMKNNTLEKGPLSENHSAAVSIGQEGNLHPTSQLVFEGNTFTNDMTVKTLFVKNLVPTGAVLEKNTYKGNFVVPLQGNGTVLDTLPEQGFLDRMREKISDFRQTLKQRVTETFHEYLK